MRSGGAGERGSDRHWRAVEKPTMASGGSTDIGEREGVGRSPLRSGGGDIAERGSWGAADIVERGSDRHCREGEATDIGERGERPTLASGGASEIAERESDRHCGAGERPTLWSGGAADIVERPILGSGGAVDIDERWSDQHWRAGECPTLASGGWPIFRSGGAGERGSD